MPKVIGWDGEKQEPIYQQERSPEPKEERGGYALPVVGSPAWQFGEWLREHGVRVSFQGGRVTMWGDSEDPDMWSLGIELDSYTYEPYLEIEQADRALPEDVGFTYLADYRGDPLDLSPRPKAKKGKLLCGYCGQEHDQVPYRDNWDPSSEECPFEASPEETGHMLDPCPNCGKTHKLKTPCSYGPGVSSGGKFTPLTSEQGDNQTYLDLRPPDKED